MSSTCYSVNIFIVFVIFIIGPALLYNLELNILHFVVDLEQLVIEKYSDQHYALIIGLFSHS